MSNQPYIDPDYRLPEFHVELPKRGNLPKVFSGYKRGSKEYNAALLRQLCEGDLFSNDNF